jgi:putative spermidine/putrescine transport system substrate-binding protein
MPFFPALSRRTLLAGAASLAAPALRAAEPVKVSQFIWTGAQEPVPRGVAAAYMKAHPDVMIDLVAGTNTAIYPRIKASLDIDATQPLVNFGFFNMDATARGRSANVWQGLDPKLVPNLANIQDIYRQPGETGAFFCMDVGGLVYNKTKIAAPPTSWADILDPKYKGKVALFDGFWVGNGLVAIARLKGGGEDNIEPGMQAFEDAAKAGQFHSFVTSNAQLQQLLVSGEVWIAPHFRGVALPWAAEGAPIGYAVPKEGQVAFPEGFQLVRGGAPAQQRVAQEIIDASLAPESVLDYCRTAAVVPLMKNVTLPPDLAADPSVQPAAMANAMQFDYGKVADNSTAWASAWNRRVKANLR